MCAYESCLKVNVSKGTIVLLQLEEAFWLQKNKGDIMSTNPNLMQICILFCTAE